MKKRIVLIVLIVLSVSIIILGMVLYNMNRELEQNRIKIYDATYPACSGSYEKFYEDDIYIYYLTCAKSDSVFVKFSNGNKMLLKNALTEDKVKIDEVINAGLDIYKEKK